MFNVVQSFLKLSSCVLSVFLFTALIERFFYLFSKLLFQFSASSSLLFNSFQHILDVRYSVLHFQLVLIHSFDVLFHANVVPTKFLVVSTEFFLVPV